MAGKVAVARLVAAADLPLPSVRRRFLALWLPYWPTDCRYRRWRRQALTAGRPAPAGDDDRPPLVLTNTMQGGVRLQAVDAAAAAEGLVPGMTLADARALLPRLKSLDADASAGEGDAAALATLADWCGRYSPWVAPDGDDGIVLDLTGCAHLFGGEAALLADLRARLRRAGIAAQGAIADTPAAAWAWARYGRNQDRGRDQGRSLTAIVPAGGGLAALTPLPLAALRLPAETLAGLSRLGLRRVGDVLALPRGPLAVRFGALVLRRLDQLVGREAAPISPRFPPAPWRSRMDFAEPIAARSDLDLACRRLLEDLCARLEQAGRGARRLVLICYRVDGGVQRIAFGTSRPVRDAGHLLRLLTERLATVEPGFGLETLLLEALVADPLAPAQRALPQSRTVATVAPAPADDLAALIDRLQNRLGPQRVVQMQPRDSHLPERAVQVQPAPALAAEAGWCSRPPRPLWLLPCPEPIEPLGATGEAVPTVEQAGVPAAFRWRRLLHRVHRAEGPERIEPEWWRHGGGARRRDYYRLEDAQGRRFWVYRDGPPAAADPAAEVDADDSSGPPAPPRWYLHGLFP